MIPRNYCKFKYEEEVSEIENILLLKCLKEYSKTIYAKNNYVKIKKKDWNPSINKKVDFKAKKENSYLPEKIVYKKEAKSDKKNHLIYRVLVILMIKVIQSVRV